MNEPAHARPQMIEMTARRRSQRAERSLRALLVLLATAAPFGCANCNHKKVAKLHREAAPVIPEGAPRELPQLPPGQPLSGEAFRKLAPDNVAGYVAQAPGEALSSPLANGGTLTTFSRNYKRGAQTLRVEYSDGLHAPLLAKVIEQQQGTTRKTELNEFRGVKVGGFPAVLQFQSGARTAYANVLIGGRVLLNARVIPADDVEAAVEVASALPLAAAAAIVPVPDGGTAAPTAEPSEPAEGEPAAEPAEAPEPSGSKAATDKAPSLGKPGAGKPAAIKPAAKPSAAPAAKPATKQPEPG